MAHFAEIDENNIVVRVIVIPNEQQHRGQEFINNELNLSGTWMQTSYNTRGNIHYNPDTLQPSEDQSKAFRKNYAGIGFIYNEELDAFIVPQPYPSWILNEDTGLWEAPYPAPETGLQIWNEEFQRWDEELPPIE